jgi:hypothetical protein
MHFIKSKASNNPEDELLVSRAFWLLKGLKVEVKKLLKSTN